MILPYQTSRSSSTGSRALDDAIARLIQDVPSCDADSRQMLWRLPADFPLARLKPTEQRDEDLAGGVLYASGNGRLS